MDESRPDPGATKPDGLLLSRDLIFTSKVTGTARALGRFVLVAGNSALAASMIGQWQPQAVFVDLAAGELVSSEAILAYRKMAGPATPFIAFGSHVDTASLDAARAAGCQPVLTRSQFTEALPELIERYLQPHGSSGNGPSGPNTTNS